ncbi:MAG: pentapeptide repeat-containing protein [Xenococcaceae cyanobacterium MO_188.B19]|nr:pentapeptide repeat-containing protein [Xenococcaceae cyanobacterium MO_188.B19]
MHHWLKMNDDNKQKGNWRLILLVGFVLGSVIAVEAFRIYPSGFNEAKNSIINRVKNFNGSWTGFAETKVITTNTETDKQEQVLKITENEEIYSKKTLWDWLELASRLAVPILLAVFWYQLQKRDKEKDKGEQIRREDEQKAKAQLERELTQDNLAEEAIQKYLDNIAKLLLNEEYREELFPTKEQESTLFLRICLFKLAIELRLYSLMRYVSSILEYSQENIEELFPTKDTSVRDLARTQTITILRRLESDGIRQDRIIHFLRDAELYKFIFENANLSGINLQEASLSDVNLQEASLSRANLEKADLWGANLQKAFLSRANLQETNLWSANLQKADLSRTKLRQANLSGANLQKADLWGANLHKANLSGAKLQETNLWGANLQETNLSRANLHKANLLDANLQETNLSHASLQEASLSGTNLQEASFWGANLQKANLSDANLQEANLSDANLQEANLSDASLEEANLSDANLHKANLSGANLQEADLWGANLQEANLSGANLIPKQIKSACFWDKAIYKGEWNWDKQTKTWIPTNQQVEQDNKKFIEELKKDKSSDPKGDSNCSSWNSKSLK